MGVKKVVYSVDGGIMITKVENIEDPYISAGFYNMSNGLWVG